MSSGNRDHAVQIGDDDSDDIRFYQALYFGLQAFGKLAQCATCCVGPETPTAGSCRSHRVRLNTGLSCAATHPDRVPDDTWQPLKSRWKVYSRWQPSDIGYLDNAARPHKVHAKSLKSGAISRGSDRPANLARSVRLSMRDAFPHQHIEQEELMFDQRCLRSRGFRAVPAAAVGIALAVLGGGVFAAQDKYSVRVPNGLAFSDFRGYENWQAVAVSQTDQLLKVMVANQTMIDAYRAGVPGNGEPFPEGS